MVKSKKNDIFLYGLVVIVECMKMEDENKMTEKIACFEYVLDRLLEWYREKRKSDTDYLSFTRLKVLKLLFFVAAVREDENGDDLLGIFDSFYAMQHGPVESDVYNAMVQNGLHKYHFEGRNVKIVRSRYVLEPTPDHQAAVDRAIGRLKAKNDNIIVRSASELVDISHRWNCWRIAMEIAILQNKGSELMDKELIRQSKQYYTL